ncbi:MAG TPA: hypothetical protein VI279_11775, partial [Rhodocyclaceae bacterium]
MAWKFSCLTTPVELGKREKSMDSFFLDQHTRSTQTELADLSQIIRFAIDSATARENLNYHYLLLRHLEDMAMSQGQTAVAEFLASAKDQLLLRTNHFEQVKGFPEPLLQELLALAGPEARDDFPAIKEQVARRAELMERLGLKYFPRIHGLFESVEQAADHYLMQGIPTAELVKPDSLLMSIGSCFARNIAAFFSSTLGCQVANWTTGEETDSARFLDYARRYGEVNPGGPELIAAATDPVLFYTIGISEVLVDSTGNTHSVGSLKSNPSMARH